MTPSSPPFAEDLVPGVALDPAPDITVDEGLAAQYLALSGDQLGPTLSAPLSFALTGRPERLANPALVISLSIGQSTVATGRVIANLRYDNLVLERQVHVGETLRTVVTPVAAAWTRSGTDRAKVLLDMSVTTHDGERIARYQRLALLPVRDAEVLVAGDIPGAGDAPPLSHYWSVVPSGWSNPAGVTSRPLALGSPWTDPLADTVSSARELVRLTQNRAAAHRDARVGSGGQRLVFGGHTVALAQASLSRLAPDLLTVLAWRSCDHLAPVFEDDTLSFEIVIDAVERGRGFRIADATVRATAHRGETKSTPVLEWRPVLLLAGEAS
ncbi:MAG: acyl dehydratase [Actinobacteria bacterium]|nr:acyl dehydratase [Actinomycetota bacterium]